MLFRRRRTFLSREQKLNNALVCALANQQQNLMIQETENPSAHSVNQLCGISPFYIKSRSSF